MRNAIYISAAAALIINISHNAAAQTAGTEAKPTILTADSRVALAEVSVVSADVSRVKRSAFNAVAVDTRPLLSTSKSLADALNKAPGIKLRETGGVGADMNIMLDGLSGRHVKVFIDGVPQEGVGTAFSLNNIPAGFAERVEVYKGVVPVGFGSDALGGVVNIVSNKTLRPWHLDASYSFGSFNTHKSHAALGQNFTNGLFYNISFFQNYSDNSYRVDAPILNFDTQHIDVSQTRRVRRFHDNFHNESFAAKVGVRRKPWADRLAVGVTYSQFYKDIQTGVRQKTVYGDKHRHGYSLMPTLEYAKRNLIKGLDIALTANFNRNATTNVDTSAFRYNWLGERQKASSQGEQTLAHTRADNNNGNLTVNAVYRPAMGHRLTLNNVFNAFRRRNTSLLHNRQEEEELAKSTRKNVAGLEYRYLPSELWNVSLFSKFYAQTVSGPMAADANASAYLLRHETMNAVGYGAAATLAPAHIHALALLQGVQIKLSFEKAYRLPSIDEMFGDEDLESGSVTLRPENSFNANANVSYSVTLARRHSVYAEAGLVLRRTNDYIQRAIAQLSGGREGAFYHNYGRVNTKGINLSARYAFSNWLSLGGNFTRMDVRDNEKIMQGSTSVANPVYNHRMPNVPYLFADFDAALTWHNLGGTRNEAAGEKANVLSLNYDGHYMHSFSYYTQSIHVVNIADFMVPEQLSHNVAVAYGFSGGRYTISAECRNMTNARLYDNFSLQKAGRSFAAKLRVHLF